jgi:oxygen-independent coproporphyrinogen-3 oxidase
VREYYAKLDNNEPPILRGHLLSDEDSVMRAHILNLMCRFETRWQKEDEMQRDRILRNLVEFKKDGLINIAPDGLMVTAKGKTFIRNICMAFDLHMMRDQPDAKLYSMTV